jgi:hypothetical protein
MRIRPCTGRAVGFGASPGQGGDHRLVSVGSRPCASLYLPPLALKNADTTPILPLFLRAVPSTMDTSLGPIPRALFALIVKIKDLTPPGLPLPLAHLKVRDNLVGHATRCFCLAARVSGGPRPQPFLTVSSCRLGPIPSFHNVADRNTTYAPMSYVLVFTIRRQPSHNRILSRH